VSSRGNLAIGDVLGDRYLIESVLGEGGMGTVYLARHIALRTPVAIKILHAQYSLDDDYRTRFVREARVTASLKHPNAVQVMDFGQFGDILYIAMEFLRGPTLRAVERHYGSDLSYDRIHGYATALADVLRAAHALPLTHRDLKPENIIVEDAYSEHERLVVVDFGLAFIANASEELGRMTETGIVVGTPLYVAPEQAEGAAVGPSADIYSLGCIFYELAAGKPPFLGKSTLAILNGHLFVPPKSLAGLVRDETVPSGFVHLVMAMLHKLPRARPTAEEVLDTLELVSPHHRIRPRARGEMAVQDRSQRAVTLSPAADSSTAVWPADQPTLRATDTQPDASAMATQPVSSGLSTGGVMAITSHIGLAGMEVTDEVIQQFAANGVGVIERPDGQPGADDALLVALEIDVEAAAAVVAAGTPVLAGARAGDMARIAGLLRAGVAEVVTLPVESTDLVRKTLRAIRKARRRQG